MKILVISDRPDNTNTLKGWLTKAMKPQPVITRCDTVSAKNKLMTDKPSVVLLDCGSVTIKDPADYITKLCPKYYVPIIAISDNDVDKVPLLKAGVMDIIIRKAGSERDGAKFLQQLVASIKNTYHTVNDNMIKRSPSACSKVIAIGGSTGSTSSLPVILRELTPDCPPIVCVLHMPEGYTKLYAHQLNSSLLLDVREALSGIYLKNGMVIIAAGGHHLRVFRDKGGYFITSEAGPKVGGHCPSVNVLFDSVAYCAKKNAIGIILTGMGEDGKRGMLNMHAMGAYNIAEDETTAIVYGMPKAAYEAGAVNLKCPLHEIAKNIKRLK